MGATASLTAMGATESPRHVKAQPWVAFPQVSPGPLIVDQMMNRSSLELWRKHDDVMKRIYCHYATLDFLSADKVSWKGVRERNSTMSLSELTLQMINFAVNPGLLTKNQLRDIMRAVDAENDADGACQRRSSPTRAIPTLLCRHLTCARTFCICMLLFCQARLSRLLQPFQLLLSCAPASLARGAMPLARAAAYDKRRALTTSLNSTHTHTHTHRTPKRGSV